MANLNVEGLKEIYVALGGSADDVAGISTIPEMLTAIAPYAQASAAELPAVTGADDGDVLTVVSGKWAKAAPAGGTVVQLQVDGTTASLPSGVTVTELKQKMAAGENVIFLGKYNENYIPYSFPASNIITLYCFTCEMTAIPDNVTVIDKVYFNTVVLMSNGSGTIYTATLYSRT